MAIVETRSGKKRFQALRNRVSCTKCRRNAKKRGLCIHESTATEAAEKDDEEEGNGNEETVSNRSAAISYTSTLPRRAFPCRSDVIAVRRVNGSLLRNQVDRVNKGLVDKDGTGIIPDCTHPEDYVSVDHQRTGNLCGISFIYEVPKRNCKSSRREVVLHTLMYGSTYISACDLKYLKCSHTTIYDGKDDGIFVLLMRTAFNLEVLDYWLYAVAMLGKTFREAFEMSRKYANSESSRNARWGDLHSVLSVLWQTKRLLHSLNALNTHPRTNCTHYFHVIYASQLMPMESGYFVPSCSTEQQQECSATFPSLTDRRKLSILPPIQPVLSSSHPTARLEN